MATMIAETTVTNRIVIKVKSPVSCQSFFVKMGKSVSKNIKNVTIEANAMTIQMKRIAIFHPAIVDNSAVRTVSAFLLDGDVMDTRIARMEQMSQTAPRCRVPTINSTVHRAEKVIL